MMSSPRLRLQTLGATLSVALALTACHPGGEGAKHGNGAGLEDALAPREVRLVTPEVREERPLLELVGELRAWDTVTVAAEVGGRVDRVLVEVGDRVEAGAPLVEIDRETYRLRLDQAEAGLAAAEAEATLAAKELERKRDLLTDETIPQAVYDQAEAAHELALARADAAEAARDLAERDWQRSVVEAQSPGAITARRVVAGQWAEVGQGLLDLAVEGAIKVAAHVPEAWAPNLEGLEGFDFRVGEGGESHHARLYAVEPAVDQASRSFEVVGAFRGHDPALRPGRFATVSLTSPEAVQTLWLPASAVATSDMPQVLLVVDGAVAVRKVQTGRRDDGNLEIVSGLASDEAVIADVSGLSRGLPVRAVDGPGQAEGR